MKVAWILRVRVKKIRDRETKIETSKYYKKKIFEDVTFKVKYERQSQRQKQHQFDLLSLSE